MLQRFFVSCLGIAGIAVAVLGGPTPVSASGQYCDGPYLSIERQDLSPRKVLEICEESANFFGQVAIVRGTRCTLCDKRDVKTVANTIGDSTGGPIKAPEKKKPDPTPPNPVPTGVTIEDSRPGYEKCDQPPTDYLLRISTSNCPTGYITRGRHWVNGKSVPGVRWCAVCPGGYLQHKLDRSKCCIRDDGS